MDGMKGSICIPFRIFVILVFLAVFSFSPGFGDPTVSTGSGSGISTPPRTPVTDVAALDTEIPSEAFIGDSLKIVEKVQNIGNTVANIVRIEYSLSSSSDGTNGHHLGWWTTMGMAPDEIISEPKLLSIPSDMHPGLYYLTKKIEVTAVPADKNSANNWWVSNIPINIRYNPADPIPDLTQVKTIWPCAQPGETVQITDTITNIGKGCAEHVAVAYYLSPYTQFDPGTAVLLGHWWIDSLCSLEQKTNNISVTIPSDLKNGEYYFYSIIDPCSFLSECDGTPELDKSNNINPGRLIIGPSVFCKPYLSPGPDKKRDKFFP
jgi:hypothetical protein